MIGGGGATLRAALDRLPRRALGFFPTPVRPLDRFRDAQGGPRVWIKRDDLTGLAFGGNKTRKLEFLVGEALERGCDTLVTGGSAQSNHCRQTAAAAAACGMECHLVLGGEPDGVPDGNLLLDTLLGATVHWAGEHRKGETIPELVAGLERAGRRPLAIPYGGSNAVGAAAFADAACELYDQLGDRLTHVVVASSSGGTQAGLTLGAYALGDGHEVVGVCIEKHDDGRRFSRHVSDLASQTAALLGVAAPNTERFTFWSDHLVAGYGVVGDLERDAIALLARTEGVILDPVYTGRAFGALVDAVRRGRLTEDDEVLFWHTGGGPAVFPHRAALTGQD